MCKIIGLMHCHPIPPFTQLLSAVLNLAQQLHEKASLTPQSNLDTSAPSGSLQGLH